MKLQSKGLHKAFHQAMEADLGPEGFEFHDPAKEVSHLIFFFGIPLLFVGFAMIRTKLAQKAIRELSVRILGGRSDHYILYLFGSTR